MSRAECIEVLKEHKVEVPETDYTPTSADQIESIVGKLPDSTQLADLRGCLGVKYVIGAESDQSAWQSFCRGLDTHWTYVLLGLISCFEEHRWETLGQVRQLHWTDFIRDGFGPTAVTQVHAAFFWLAFCHKPNSDMEAEMVQERRREYVPQRMS